MKAFLKSTYKKALPVIASLDPYINLLTLPKKMPSLEWSGRIPKIAFVKQDVFLGLYCCEAHSPPSTLLSSSLKHSGPMSLFTEFGADFFIVKEEMDPECQIWTQTVTECGHSTLESARALKTKPFMDGKRGHTRAPGEFAVSVESIDWSQYDIVISACGSVPARITQKYPKTVWVYIIDHPTTSTYIASNKNPLKGYDLFLNIRFRNLPLLPRPPASFEIDFPFNLQNAGCFHKTYDKKSEWLKERHGVFIESHTAMELKPEQLKSLEKFGPLYFVKARTEDIIHDLMKAKYYIRMGGRLLWGNGMIEAIAAGALALGDPKEYVNRGLFTPATTVSSWKALLKRLEYFESEEGRKKFHRALKEQRDLLNWLCYFRPIKQLFEKSSEILKKRNLSNLFLNRA